MAQKSTGWVPDYPILPELDEPNEVKENPEFQSNLQLPVKGNLQKHLILKKDSEETQGNTSGTPIEKPKGQPSEVEQKG
ncbi:MAG: hypothetical protein V7K69_17190 [Nostoc sp.]|uniref:hypothetical protein n=1 Tax=Nostoc sp. TaxID=1180 RepID=UPI002FF57B5B